MTVRALAVVVFLDKMIDRKSLLLLAVSTTAALLVSEIGLRLFTPYGPHRGGPAQRHLIGDSDGSPGVAFNYILQMDAARGTDREWFKDDPAPLPRVRVDPLEQSRYLNYDKRGIYGPQAQYIWNRRYLESHGCQQDGPFKNYPKTVQVFDPPSNTELPRYRFPVNTTTPAGLVTNQYGLRGPQIALAKPSKTVRIAFLGASTTINDHSHSFSFPERTVHWLNRYAQSNHLDVNFEVINAGREGFGSEDIAAVARDEVLPLDPDLLIYYEGANQFGPQAMIFPRIFARPALDPNDSAVSRKIPAWLTAHSAIGDLLDRVLNGFASAGEPKKPWYVLRWPLGVSEGRADPDHPRLPLDLTNVVRCLDNIRGYIRPLGAQFALASFERLAADSMLLSPVRHRYIYQQLNTTFWPVTYADMHRLNDYQNRIFRAYADSRHILFLDIPPQMPQDPGLFVDSVHMKESGERVKAWIFFQQLVPYVRQRIDSAEWPRKGPSPQLPPPSRMESVEAAVCATDGRQ